MGHYTVVATTESGTDGRPKAPGAINGGFVVSLTICHPRRCRSPENELAKSRAVREGVSHHRSNLAGRALRVPASSVSC
jgi:hypothetical protein